MGVGTSFLNCNDEDDDGVGVEYDGSQGGGGGVIKRIPIEVKERGKLGKLQSARSINKPKNESLRSALSIDAEHPDVERMRKELELFRHNKENEMANAKKKEAKLETENRKLRAELQALQKTCKKQKSERDAALEAEHRALMRAAAIESDRDKIQRQFKIFRETKESELQNLLRAKRELENKIEKFGVGGALSLFEDIESASKMEAAPDWWTTHESEPSLASSIPLPCGSVYRGPEFAHSAVDKDGPYVNINKDDWQAAQTSFVHAYPSHADIIPASTLVIFITGSSDVQQVIDLFIQDYESKLCRLCAIDGRQCLIINMPIGASDSSTDCSLPDKNLEARCRQINRCSVFVAFIGQELDRFVEMDLDYTTKVKSTGKKCFLLLQRQLTENARDTAERLKSTVLIEDKRLFTYESCRSGVDLAYHELERCLVQEFGVEKRKRRLDDDDCAEHFKVCELNDELLEWGTRVQDVHFDYEQMNLLDASGQSTCELGFEKYYERLNTHVSSAGPVPPLLLCGPPGVGKSLLLTKWMELQQYKSTSSILLYHFVDSPQSRSADPILMIRRLTVQLMRLVTVPPTLTSDTSRLVEEFPKWLEKVSAKVPGGIILILDSIDRFQKAETHLKWLMDPLPVDLRVVVSVDIDHCPTCPTWKSWPSLTLEVMSYKNVKDLLHAQLSSHGTILSSDHESLILAHCVTRDTCCPLYVVLLATYIARHYNDHSLDTEIRRLLQTTSAVELYQVLITLLIERYTRATTTVIATSVTTTAKKAIVGTDLSVAIIRQVLLMVYVSRNGVMESELFGVMRDAGLTWSHWSPVCSALVDQLVLTFHAELLVFAHQQVREAVARLFLSEDNEDGLLREVRLSLRNYHAQFKKSLEVTYRTADELPWLSRQLGDKTALQEHLLNINIFVKLYIRGEYAELASSWSFVGLEKTKMSNAYMAALKELEDASSLRSSCSDDDYDYVSLATIADLYELLGQFFKDLGLLTQALAPLQRSLEIRETALDPDHPSVARSLHALGDLHFHQNKTLTAEALYKQALEIYKSSLGESHPLVAREMVVLASLYQKQGKHELADPLQKRAAAIRKTNGLSISLATCKSSSDAVQRRITEVVDLTWRPDSIDTARTLNEIGVLYYLQNNIAAAESLFIRAVDMRESLLPPNHPDIAQSLNNLAALYNDNKQYEKAAPLYERALEIRRNLYPLEHSCVVSLLKNLGILYKKTGRLAKAEQYYLALIEGKENSFGPSHPSVATALVNLAVLYSQQSKHVEAEPLYERALRIYEESLDPHHPRVSETLKNMALLKYEQGDLEAATKLYKRATEIAELVDSPLKGQPHSIHSNNSASLAL